MQDKLFNMFDEYKIVVFIPKEKEKEIVEKLLAFDLNEIGEYRNCMSWSDVTSTWTPTERANPYLGQNGVRSIEREVRIEFLCKRSDLKKNVEYIKSIHPYETAEIDIVPIINADQL